MMDRGPLARTMVAQLPALRRYALGLTGHVPAADDLVQDCIERALQRLGSLQDHGKVAAWLRTILFNAFIDDRRRWRARGETVGDELLYTLPDTSSDPHASQELQQVLRAAASLPPQLGQILLLVGVEGLSYREAAAELGVPIGTVMSRLARARDQLRGLLDGTRVRGPDLVGKNDTGEVG